MKEFAPDYDRDANDRVLFPRDTDMRRILFPFTDPAEHIAKCNMLMIKELVEFVSEPGETILDPFAGTGTILVAATMGRFVTMIELLDTFCGTIELNTVGVKQTIDYVEDLVNLIPGDAASILPIEDFCDHMIFSPPYPQGLKKKGTMDKTSKDLGYDHAADYSEDDQRNFTNLNDFLYHQKIELFYKKCLQSLKPGGTMTVIIKDRMEKGQRVRQADRTERDCVRLGFELVARNKWYARGGGYCLHPDTKVLTADLHWRKLSSVSVGDSLLGIEEWSNEEVNERRSMRRAGVKLEKRHHRRLLYNTATAMTPIELEAYEINFFGGRKVIASKNHMWLEYTPHKAGVSSSPRWVKTKDLHPAQFLRQLTEEVWEEQTTYEAGYLSGMLDGEGWLQDGRTRATHGMRVGVTQKEGKTLDRIIALMQAFGIPFRFPLPDKKGIVNGATPSMGAALKLLGSIRPKRLLEKINLENLSLPRDCGNAVVEKIRPLGVTKLIAIETSSKTLFAEGIVSHNSAINRAAGLETIDEEDLITLRKPFYEIGVDYATV
jgi:hypothetical protein